MNPDVSLFSSLFTALALRVTGIILIVAAIVNGLIAALPPQFDQSDWFANLITQWVNQGTLPMLGLAALFGALWIDRRAVEETLQPQNARPRWLLWPLLLSALLGLLFLVLTPLYFASTNQVSAAKVAEVNQQATQAQAQLDQLLEQQRNQVNSLIANEQQYAQLQQEVEKAQLPEDQKAQLRQLQSSLQQVKNDPKLLDQKVEEARSQGLKRIQQQQQQALAQAAREVHKARIQIISASLLLAIGYLAIAGLGVGVGRAPRSDSQS